MYVLPDYDYPYSINSIEQPVVIEYFWVYNAKIKDQVLAPIMYFEETSGNIINVNILNFSFDIPTNWHILVTDKHTSMIDSISVTEAINKNHDVVIISSKHCKHTTAKISINEFKTDNVCVHPKIDKGRALIHPIGTDEKNPQVVWSIIISPHDLYEYLEHSTVKELLI